jgi:hypothetical protein
MGTILAELASAHRLKGLSQSSRQALEGLRHLLPTVIFKNPQQAGNEWLARGIAASGMFWENKLTHHILTREGRPLTPLAAQDLKGTLLVLLAALKKEFSSQSKVESLIGQVNEVLHLIENDQTLNSMALRNGWGWYYLIPGLPETGLRQAEVFGRRLQSEEGFHLHIYLDLTALGKMDVTLFLAESRVSIHIRMDDAQKADFVSENLKYLESSINAKGLSVGALQCEVRADNEMPFTFPGDKEFTSVDMVV